MEQIILSRLTVNAERSDDSGWALGKPVLLLERTIDGVSHQLSGQNGRDSAPKETKGTTLVNGCCRLPYGEPMEYVE